MEAVPTTALLLPLEVAPPPPVAAIFVARPAKYQDSSLLVYCNTFVNLSLPSSVKTQAIQFLTWNGDRLAERPVWSMDRADDCVGGRDGGV